MKPINYAKSLLSIGAPHHDAEGMTVFKVERGNFPQWQVAYFKERRQGDPTFERSLQTLKETWRVLNDRAFGASKLIRASDPKSARTTLKLTALEEVSPDHLADRCQELSLRIAIFEITQQRGGMTQAIREKLIATPRIELLRQYVYEILTPAELAQVRKAAISTHGPMHHIPKGMEQILTTLPPAMDPSYRPKSLSFELIERVMTMPDTSIENTPPEPSSNGTPTRFELSPL